MVLTNRHLLELIAKRPASATALGRIHGIGKAKVERYGAALLEILARHREGGEHAGCSGSDPEEAQPAAQAEGDGAARGESAEDLEAPVDAAQVGGTP